MADSVNYDHVKIQGIPPINGKPGIRKEFTAFATEKPGENIQVSLFIRGLNRWHTEPYTERISYFQVPSIHGYPGGLRWDKSDPPHKIGTSSAPTSTTPTDIVGITDPRKHHPLERAGQHQGVRPQGQGRHSYSVTDGFGGITSKYSHYEPLPEVTRGKAAGASHEEYRQMGMGSA